MIATSFEHNGYTVTLADNFRFHVTHPAGDGTWCESASSARVWIDKQVAAQQRQGRTKLNIPVLLEDGSRATITGVHGSTFNALGINTAYAAWPDVAWIRAALNRRKALRGEVEKISKSVGAFVIDTRHHYGAKDHATAVADLQQRADKALAEAIAAEPK
ncbi:MAG: hypothetical protein KGL39_40820 [Patescibacteria group bacterium]|nr:hypothetical protein [Patescibacteria group bacterium]